MRASQESIKAAIEKLAQAFPVSKSSPAAILVAAARLYEAELTDRELAGLTRKAIDTLDHFPSTAKLLKLVDSVRSHRRARGELSAGYDIELERRYRALLEAPDADRRAIGARYEAIIAARYRRRAPNRLTELEDHDLDNRLAALGLDARGRPFFACPLQPDAAPVAEPWEPGADG